MLTLSLLLLSFFISLEAPEPETSCSMSYLSPEFLAGNHEFCPKCDLWAMGVCLFFAVSQKMPQDHNSIKMGFPPKSSNCYSKELLQYIRWSISPDENERPETVEEMALHPLLNEHRVNQIRTVFDLPLPISKKNSRISEDDLEPWQFHGRSSTISATKPWISAIVDVKSKNYILAISYCGQVTALTKAGDHVLWSRKIVADGARGGIWHAAMDEKRGRLLITYNGTGDPVNVFPVDVYFVRLVDLETACANARLKTVEPTLSSEESDEVSDVEVPAPTENEAISSDESVASSFSVVDSNHSGHKSVASSKASSKHSEAKSETSDNSVNSKHSDIKSNKSDKSEIGSQKSEKSKKSETKSTTSSKSSSVKSKGSSHHSVPVSVKAKRPSNSSSSSSSCSKRTGSSNGGFSVVKAELFFHHDEWRCSGLRIDVENDHLYVCDWFGNKIGIWNLEDIEPEADPIHVIGKPEQFKHFNPTRCDIIPISKGISNKENDSKVTLEPKVQYLAVSDWLRSRVYLFKTTAIKNTINHEFEATITSKGSDVGMVATPIDIQCDPTARTLIVCDQNNNRAQLFIPDPEWPDFKAVATENLGGHFSAVTITQDYENSASDNIRVLLAGMNTGEVIAFKFKNA